VSHNTKKSLEKINEVSRQLLSRILAVQNKLQENTTTIKKPSNDESNIDSSITDNELSELMVTRDKMISCLFKEKTTEEIAQESTLLNEMISLDSELSSASQTCKKTLAEQVIRLKKSKQVTKSYQKY
jgi:K+/H+ antiporter YhaU regulatory subunit KhtT